MWRGDQGVSPISPRSSPPGMLLLANILSGEERGRNSCFRRLWHCNPRLILKRPRAYRAAQKSEFSQLRLKQTQKHLSLTVNTDTAVYAWIVFLRQPEYPLASRESYNTFLINPMFISMPLLVSDNFIPKDSQELL